MGTLKNEVRVEDLVAGMTRTLERRRMVEHPAYVEGKDAFKNGETRDANPYRSSSSSFYKWFAGWDEGQQADGMDLIKMEKARDLRKNS